MGEGQSIIDWKNKIGKKDKKVIWLDKNAKKEENIPY